MTSPSWIEWIASTNMTGQNLSSGRVLDPVSTDIHGPQRPTIRGCRFAIRHSPFTLTPMAT
ncbi:hypothetical protein GFS60_07622 (plasmid) [Rhodococcus sp. WAY2]|nr:hypothetical protein GFS60_07622 [Rhodococcus sp. WAY2]